MFLYRYVRSVADEVILQGNIVSVPPQRRTKKIMQLEISGGYSIFQMVESNVKTLDEYHNVNIEVSWLSVVRSVCLSGLLSDTKAIIAAFLPSTCE